MRRALIVLGRFACVAVPFALASSLDSAQLTIVRGRVVAFDDSAAPMRGARVALVGTTATADPVFTDGDGRFALGVPASYTLQVSKAGYAPVVVSGRASAASPDMQVRLPRGAALTGRVADELGFPVVSAVVRARWLIPPTRLSASIAELTADTDDNGEFRMGSLPAGRYSLHSEQRALFNDLMGSALSSHSLIQPPELVAAREKTWRALRPPQPLSEVVTIEVRSGEEALVTILHQQRAVTPVDAPIGGAVTGTVVDQFGEPVDQFTVRLWRVRYADGRRIAEPTQLVRRVNDRGQYRLFHVPPAQYIVVAMSGDLQHAPVYHPGVTTIANSPPVTVERRQEVPGVHIAFARTRNSRLSGVVQGAAGERLRASVNLIARRAGAVTLPPVRGSADADGVFEFPNVVPGDYFVQARSDRSDEFGLQPVTIAEGDNEPVTVVMLTTATISGRVVVDDGTAVPKGLRLGAVMDPEYAPVGPAPFATIPGDGAFAMTGLAGPTRFALITGVRGYRLKSVDVGSVNGAEEPVHFGSAKDSRADVTVTLSADVGMVAGRVTDDGGREPDDYRVIAFPLNRERRFPNSPYVEIVGGPNVDGGFVVLDLPPGEYWLAAVAVVDGDAVSGEWQTPEFLESLVRGARRVSVGEGQRVAADLRLIRR